MGRELVRAAADTDPPPPLHRVSLSGELDLSALPALRAQLRELIDLRAPTVAIVNMADVTFMDCSALGSLIEARTRLGRRLVLNQASRPVVRLLELCGHSDMLVGPGEITRGLPGE